MVRVIFQKSARALRSGCRKPEVLENVTFCQRVSRLHPLTYFGAKI